MSDTATEPMGLRERNKERRRTTILQCAYHLFAERGYNATTIADIAAAADIAPRTVSLYFPSKQDIVLNGVMELIRPLSEALEALQPGDSAIDVILEALRVKLKASRDRENEHLPARLKTDPDIHGIITSSVEQLELSGQRAVAREIGCAPDDLRVTITLTAARSVLELAMFSNSTEEIDRIIDLGKQFLNAGLNGVSTTPAGA